MTNGRRSLSFSNIDEILPEVERLLSGHTVVGTWSLAQICRHLSSAMRRVVDLPASTPIDPAFLVSEEKKREVFATGMISEGMPGPPEIMPAADVALDERAEFENLRSALDHYRASPGPVIPHRFFGRLSKEEWDRLQCIHCAHHLSFVIPK